MGLCGHEPLQPIRSLEFYLSATGIAPMAFPDKIRCAETPILPVDRPAIYPSFSLAGEEIVIRNIIDLFLRE